MPSARNASRPVAQPARPLPIQNVQFTEGEVKDPKQLVAKLNVFLQQLVPSVQALQGTAGPTVLPSGVDVAGQTITGLGAPKGPTDAVSQGHADANYGASAVSPQLDVGGSNSLKGLSSIYLQMTQSFSGTIPLAKLTSGGSNGSITVSNGLIASVVPPT